MAKIVLGWIAIFLTAIWVFLSWNAYVCNIKGFCGDGEKNKNSYSRIYDREEKEEEKMPEKLSEKKESYVIREVFFRSSEAELAEILADDGQRVVVAMWKREVKDQKNPVSFEQFLEVYRENAPKQRKWTPRDFLPPAKEIPTYENGSPELPPVEKNNEEEMDEETESDTDTSEDSSSEKEENIEEEKTDVTDTQENQNTEEKSSITESEKSEESNTEDENSLDDTEESDQENNETGEENTVTDVTEEAAFCPDYVTTYIQVYAENDKHEVEKLETFLKDYEGYDIVVDGFYSLEDNEMVKQFQARYADEILAPLGITEPTGNVYAKTMQKINSIYCSR